MLLFSFKVHTTNLWLPLGFHIFSHRKIPQLGHYIQIISQPAEIRSVSGQPSPVRILRSYLYSPPLGAGGRWNCTIYNED